jgi:putative FmdB family regulatory protein
LIFTEPFPMPIYEYRCTSCGHQQEFLQKLSDAPIKRCTSCGKDSFAKMVTAAGFQLKGSGWYATDFKTRPATKPATGTDAAKPAEATKPGDAAASGDASRSGATSKSAETAKSGSSTGSSDGAKAGSGKTTPAAS